MKTKTVFICGPYRDEDGLEAVRKNIVKARGHAIEVAAQGAYPVCPHTNTGFLENEQALKGIGHNLWLEGSTRMLEGCDMLYLTDGMLTEGMRKQLNYAKVLGIPTVTSIFLLKTWLKDNETQWVDKG